MSRHFTRHVRGKDDSRETHILAKTHSLVARGCQCMCWHSHLENELLEGKNEAHPFSAHKAPTSVICAKRSMINIYYGDKHIWLKWMTEATVLSKTRKEPRIMWKSRNSISFLHLKSLTLKFMGNYIRASYLSCWLVWLFTCYYLFWILSTQDISY